MTEAESESPEEAPTGESGAFDEPIRATVYEKAVASLVLVLMAAAMAYALATVVMYWDQVGV